MGKKACSCSCSCSCSDVEAAGWNNHQRPPPPSSCCGSPYLPLEPWTPWLIPTFVAANVVGFVLTMYLNDCPSKPSEFGPCLFPVLGRFSFQPFKENHVLGPSRFTLDSLGALDWQKVVLQQEWWRLITCMWLHGGVVHLVANMLSLVFIGIRLEREFGFVKIGALYVLSGFGGSLASSLSLHGNISVGSSGALFGLLGAMLSELITNWTIYANKFAALLTLSFVIAINLAVGALPRVDNSAHIGGFVSGFLLGFVLLIRPQFGWVSHKLIPSGYDTELVKPKYKTYQYLLWAIALVLLIIGYIGGLVELYSPNHWWV